MGSVNESRMDIPSIDLSSLTLKNNTDKGVRNSIARDLLSKASENGFIAIRGHGIPSHRLDQAFAMSRSLFQLPYEDKMKAPHPDAEVPHRGYSAPGREQGAAKTAHLEQDQANERNTIQQNIWLQETVRPGFRKLGTEIFGGMNKLAQTILNLLIVSLDLTVEEVNKIKDLHIGNDNHLRLNHYPPFSKYETKKSVVFSRLGPHTDWSTFTLLFQDDCGGLEFRDSRTLQFVPAVPREGAIYMNIGDMFERLSNGIYPSAYHRVVGYGEGDESNPSAETSRCSIVYFVVPLNDGIIEPMPSLIMPNRKQICEPFKYCECSEHLHTVINKY